MRPGGCFRALLAHDRQHGLGDPQCAEQVRLELRPGLAFGDLFDHSEQPVSGVVDRDVDPTEPRQALRCRAPAANSSTPNRAEHQLLFNSVRL